MIVFRKIKRIIFQFFDYYQFLRISFMNKEKKFSYIYKSKYWQNIENGSVSGGGSNEVSTNIIKDGLKKFIVNNNIQSIVDIPCGDWKWMSKINLDNVNYIGCDVVEDLIESNISMYKKNNIDFSVKNLVRDKLPNADLIIIRDLLVHLDDSDIILCLENIKKSNYRYVGITNYPQLENNNKRLFGDYLRLGDKWRAINLSKTPYNLPNPTHNLSDKNNLSEIDKNKYISIWNYSDFDITHIKK
jgi:hypothetical protein